jgi:hypothetical protein
MNKASVELALSLLWGLSRMLAHFSVAAISAITPVTAIPALVPAVMAPIALISVIIVPVSLIMVFRLVSAGFHEVHGAIAGVVAVAIPGPVFRVTRRYMQIQWFHPLAPWLGDDDHRLGIDDLWRRGIAELHLAIDTRADFTADCQVDDRRPGTGRQTGERQCGKNCG